MYEERSATVGFLRPSNRMPHVKICRILGREAKIILTFLVRPSRD
jgi:hypothetical protein